MFAIRANRDYAAREDFKEKAVRSWPKSRSWRQLEHEKCKRPYAYVASLRAPIDRETPHACALPPFKSALCGTTEDIYLYRTLSAICVVSTLGGAGWEWAYKTERAHGLMLFVYESGGPRSNTAWQKTPPQAGQ